MQLLLSKKIEEARVLASQKKAKNSTSYNSDEDITDIFQRKFNKLYYMLVEKAENYFCETKRYNKVLRDESLNLPNNFYKLMDVAIIRDDRRISLTPIDKISSQRNNVNVHNFPDTQYGYGNVQDYYYTLYSNFIKIVPALPSKTDFEIKYTPDVPLITNIFKVNEDDLSEKTILRIPYGFYDWLVYESALDMLITKEDDVRDIKDKSNMLWRDIVSWAEDRKTSFPDKIRETDDGYYETQLNYYGNGKL